MRYDTIPPETLSDFRRDMIKISWETVKSWSTRDQDQVITLIADDFEFFMNREEHLALRDAYLTTTDNEARKQILFEHYQNLLKNREIGQ